MVEVVFADFENIPEYSFGYKTLVVSFVMFVVSYELIMSLYSRETGRQPVKIIMLE